MRHHLRGDTMNSSVMMKQCLVERAASDCAVVRFGHHVACALCETQHVPYCATSEEEEAMNARVGPNNGKKQLQKMKRGMRVFSSFPFFCNK
jgi:hypothetical protein